MNVWESMQRRLNVLEDLLYIIKNRRMAKRIQSGDSVSPAVIREKLVSLLRYPGLTREQVRQVRACYYPYQVSTIAHREMLALTGEFDPENVPHEMYFAYLDPWLNSRKKAVGLENKCLFGRLFPGVPQPETVAYRMNGFWLTPELAPMTLEAVFAAVEKCGTVFVKQAEDSYGGRGVVKVPAQSSRKDLEILLETALSDMRGDVLIQKPIRQHEATARINPASVNTYRVVTLMTEDGPQLLSAIARFGAGDTAVDNYTSGGLICGIDEAGKLKRFAYSHTGRCETHPVSGIRFEGYALPAFAEAVEMVKKAHPMLPCSRLICWDIAVEENGRPVLIEANLSEGGIESLQLTNGPLLTGSSRKIIDEALKDSDFPRYRRTKRT